MLGRNWNNETAGRRRVFLVLNGLSNAYSKMAVDTDEETLDSYSVVKTNRKQWSLEHRKWNMKQDRI